jgi:hypothetical protein
MDEKLTPYVFEEEEEDEENDGGGGEFQLHFCLHCWH